MPNIERKRLDKVDERLDGITQTLELVAAMQLKTEAELDKLSRFVRLIGADHNKRITKLEKGKK